MSWATAGQVTAPGAPAEGYCRPSTVPRPAAAFTNRSALLRWLESVGLSLTAELPEHGVHSYQKLTGSYSTDMHFDMVAFFNLPGHQRVPTMSNGDYTLGIITEENGHRTVHTLNPNVKGRPVFDYQSTRAEWC